VAAFGKTKNVTSFSYGKGLNLDGRIENSLLSGPVVCQIKKRKKCLGSRREKRSRCKVIKREAHLLMGGLGEEG